MMREHEDMDSFLDEVCTQVKAREMHLEIREEIGTHLQELIAQKEAEGYTTKEAASWAFQQMGDPAELGKGLHQVHKPRIYWGLLMTVLLFSIMSLFAMWSVDASYQKTVMSFVNFTKHQFIFVILGIVIMCGLYFWDFRKLKDYSWLLYLITVGGMVLTRLFGVHINGASRYISIGPIQLDWIGISPYLLVTAIAGILMNSSVRKLEGRKNYRLLEFLLIVAPVVIYMMVPAMPELFMYLIVSFVLIGWLSHKWLQSSLIAAGLFLTGIIYVWYSPYLWNRLMAAITPMNDPSGAGYLYLQMAAVIRSSGWWGNGFGANHTRLPFIYSEMFLTYMISCFGWGAGLVLLSVVIWFLTRLAHAVKAVREPNGRTLILVLSMLLAIPLVYGLAMASGKVLIINLPFPFLSYGGSHLMIEYAVVGLLLGVYRRKDMIPLHKQTIVDKVSST
jgi:cell division protein FtsW (lipid II flippase)